MKTVQGVLLLSTRPGEIDGILADERSVILLLAAVALAATVFTPSCSPVRWRARCAGSRRRPSMSAAMSRRARTCRNIPTARTRSGRWRAPSAR